MKEFDNADSFGIAFDAAWLQESSHASKNKQSKKDKLETVLDQIKDHPFTKNNPVKAREIAEFRIRLLNLN